MQAGDIVFVPDNLAHAVINDDTSIAIGTQLAFDVVIDNKNRLRRITADEYEGQYRSTSHPEL